MELLGFSKEVKEDIKKIKSSVSKNKFWAIYVLPNGKTEVAYDSSKTENFSQKINFFNDIKGMIGGEILEPKINNDI